MNAALDYAREERMRGAAKDLYAALLASVTALEATYRIARGGGGFVPDDILKVIGNAHNALGKVDRP